MEAVNVAGRYIVDREAVDIAGRCTPSKDTVLLVRSIA